MELRPCPWCREEWIKVRSGSSASFTAECQGCAAMGPEADSHDAAIRFWNARPTADLGDDGELVERLRKGVTWSDGKRIDAVVGAVNDPVMAEAADRLILYREALERIAGMNLSTAMMSAPDITRAVLSRSGG
jgi:hypothetical protein